MAGLSSTGFTVKRLTDIIASLKSRAVTEFSPFIEEVGDVVDTSDRSVLGRWINVVSVPIADLWETAQDVYSAFNIDSAQGVALEQLVALGGGSRKTPTASQAMLISYGTYNITIPDGSYVRSTTNHIFEFQEDVLLDENSAKGIQITPTVVSNSTLYSFTYQVAGSNPNPVTVSFTSSGSATTANIVAGFETEINDNHGAYISASIVDDDLLVEVADLNYICDFAGLSQFTINKAKKGTEAICTETGALKFDANTINTIQSPLVGWDSVTNPFAALDGTDLESDASLRFSYLKSKFQDGSNTYEAIYSAVSKVNGVQQIVIYENETDDDFVDPPVPAHSFHPIVLGGVDQEIAQAIWNNKPAGILSYGDVTVQIEDSAGVLHDVSFNRPTEVPIYISIAIVKDDTFPLDGADLIKQAIVDYISDFTIGQDVIFTRLFSPINSAASGFYVDNMSIDSSPTPTTSSNIVIDSDEIANISSSNISISYVS